MVPGPAVSADRIATRTWSGHRGQRPGNARAEVTSLETSRPHEPPLRLLLGSYGLPVVEAIYAQRLITWKAWEKVTDAADGAVA